MLLLDEPTRGIDVGAKAEVQALIDELAETGPGRAAHLLATWRSWSRAPTAVVVLRDGAVVGELSGDDVTEDGDHGPDRGRRVGADARPTMTDAPWPASGPRRGRRLGPGATASTLAVAALVALQRRRSPRTS